MHLFFILTVGISRPILAAKWTCHFAAVSLVYPGITYSVVMYDSFRTSKWLEENLNIARPNRVGVVSAWVWTGSASGELGYLILGLQYLRNLHSVELELELGIFAARAALRVPIATRRSISPYVFAGGGLFLNPSFGSGGESSSMIDLDAGAGIEAIAPFGLAIDLSVGPSLAIITGEVADASTTRIGVFGQLVLGLRF